jgi:hypothetical protein
MATVNPQHPNPALKQSTETAHENHQEVILYSHSSLFYWWPAWAVGYLMALITYLDGEQFQIGSALEYYHPSTNLGIFFLLTLFLVVIITNTSVRGMASAVVILVVVLVTVVLAFFRLWDEILGWFDQLKVHINLGGYFWFATLMLLAWLLNVFVFDRMSCWRFKPGQITREHVLGAASRTYDTQNMVLEKYRDDFFRHWVLGFGSGDLRIKTHGAVQEEFVVPNVLFLGSRLHEIQHLIAMEPSSFGHTHHQERAAEIRVRPAKNE